MAAELPAVALTSLSSTDTETEAFVNRRFRFDRRRFNRRFSGIFDLRDCAKMCSGCFFLVIPFWIFGVLSVLGAERPTLFWIGPNTSILLELNPLVFKNLKVKDVDGSTSGLQLWGLYKSPSLDVVQNWSQSRLVSVPHRSYKGWPFYLNKGSLLNISYSVKPEGMQNISKWLEDKPENQYRALSWNLVRGSGMVEVNISDSSDYYVALANSRMKDVMIDIHVSSVLYDTKQSFYNCTFTNGECTFNNPMSLVGNSVVLTSPGPRKGITIEGEEDEWKIKFSYEFRWIPFAIGTLVVYFIAPIGAYSCKRFGERKSIRTPLLTRKDGEI